MEKGNGNWDKIKRWFRYWIRHRMFGWNVLLEDIPRIDIEKSEFKSKIRLCRRIGPTKGKCSKR